MPTYKLYALTKRQAAMLQHSIEALELDAAQGEIDMTKQTKRSLDEAWQSLSRPICVAARTLKRK